MTEAEYILSQLVKKIPKNAIKNGKLDEKLIEVVVRRSDGKISSMVKCALENSGNQKLFSKIIKNIPMGAVSGVGTVSSLANNVQTEMVRREVKKVGKDVKEVLDLTKNISTNIDKIAQGISVVQSISIANIALSATNLGVNVVGFTVMNRKLDNLKDELFEIKQLVNEIKDMRIIEIINEGQEILDKSRTLYGKISCKRASIKEYEELLNCYRSYLRNLRDFIYCGHFDFENGYKIIMNMLPVYADLLKKYIFELYYSMEMLTPALYETHIAIIQSFAEQNFLDILFDTLYLYHDISKIDAENVEGIHLFTVGKMYTELEDTKDLLLAIPKKEDFLTFDTILSEISKERILETLPLSIEGVEYNREELINEINNLFNC